MGNPPEQQPEEDPTPRNQLKGNKMAAKGVFCFLLVSALATLATAYPEGRDPLFDEPLPEMPFSKRCHFVSVSTPSLGLPMRTGETQTPSVGKMDLASVMCPATLTVATSSKPQAYQGASLSMPASSRMGFFCCLAENRCFYLFFYFFIFLFCLAENRCFLSIFSFFYFVWRKIYVEGKATTNSFLSDAMNC